MSIASEITRLQTSKADSKAQINIDKDIINDGIDFINNEKVDSYDEKIAEMQEAYKQYIPINSTSDTQIDAQKGGTIIGKTIKGNTLQDSTPTPDTPVEIKTVTGLQNVNVSNGTNSKDYEINLGNIELSKIGNYQDYIRKGTGKNILNLPNGTYTNNGVSYSCNNQEITLNNTATANSFINVFNSGEYLYLKKGTYTISANNPTSAGGSSGQNVIRLTDTNGSNVVSASVCTMNVANATATFTITEEKNYIIQVRTQSGTSYTNFKLRPQLEERKSSNLLRTLWL